MDIMLDLETLDTAPTAAIIAIGAVAFTESEFMGEFYAPVDVSSALQFGTVSGDTLKWWAQKPDAARSVIWDKDALPLFIALQEFAAWLCTFENLSVWGNGAAFDNAIIAHAYRKIGVPLPWDFRRDRCYRTLCALHPGATVERTGVHHNALDDAKHQARVVQKTVKMAYQK